MSQADLARALGVTQQSVSKWEDGRSVPRGRRLEQLAGALGKKSHTAMALATTLPGPQQLQAQPMEAQTQALLALAQAAQDIARAAQALAESVERISNAKAPPPRPRH